MFDLTHSRNTCSDFIYTALNYFKTWVQSNGWYGIFFLWNHPQRKKGHSHCLFFKLFKFYFSWNFRFFFSQLWPRSHRWYLCCLNLWPVTFSTWEEDTVLPLEPVHCGGESNPELRSTPPSCDISNFISPTHSFLTTHIIWRTCPEEGTIVFLSCRVHGLWHYKSTVSLQHMNLQLQPSKRRTCSHKLVYTCLAYIVTSFTSCCAFV